LSPTLRSRDELIKDARRAGPFRLARQEAAGLVTSFNYAFEGVIYVVRTQRNMRVHFAVALSVLPLGVALGVTRFELLALLLSVSFVLIAEMFNTALEKAIDVATNSFDPLARTAKDVAAGAVLVAAVNATFVGYLVFAERLRNPSRRAIDTVRGSPVHLTVIALALVIMIVIALKARTDRGTLRTRRQAHVHAGRAGRARVPACAPTVATPHGRRGDRLVARGGHRVRRRRARAGCGGPGSDNRQPLD
jgi:diacylglycerol kinase (ATP)